MPAGSLAIVGTGICTVGQLTTEAIALMRSADELLYLVSNPTAARIVDALNDRAESLATCYADGKPRRSTYDEIVERILESVRAGRRTCVAFYGHPGVFVLPSHRAIAAARREGFEARMYPAVSASDCLYADLGVDPATDGVQAYEATDFLMHRRAIEPSASLVLWQIGLVANWTYQADGYDLRALPLLVERLGEVYPREHPVTVYEAAIHPGCDAWIAETSLGDLPEVDIRPMATMFVPPLGPPERDVGSWTRLAELGLLPDGTRP